MKEIPTPLLRILRKISLFRGLSPAELSVLLRACKQGTVPVGVTLCRAGEGSMDLYILLSGTLDVVTADGVSVGRVRAVNTVGEMGFITRELRSATLVAAEPSTVLSLGRPCFEELLKHSQGMRVKLYGNIIALLSEKIITGNVQTRDLKVAQMRSEQRIAELQERLAAALDMLAERAGADRDVLEREQEQRIHAEADVVGGVLAQENGSV